MKAKLLLFLTILPSILFAGEDRKEALDLQRASPIKEYSFWSEFGQMVLSLGGLLLVMMLVAWCFRKAMDKRLTGFNRNSLIKIVERRSIHAKAGIYLVRVRNKEILVAESPVGLQTLTQYEISEEESEETPRGDAVSSDFISSLEKKDS